MASKSIRLSSNKKPRSRAMIANKSKKKIASRSKNSRNIRLTQALTRKVAKGILIFISIGLIGMLGGTVYAFIWLQGLNNGLPTLEEVFPNPPVSSRVFDRNGVQLYKIIGDVNSDPVDINVIPEKIKWPFLAAEDEDFYNHDGFDTAAILRCAVNIARSIGTNVCGGSTITQQLIKNTALRDVESRVERKIQELFMSTEVEKANSKDEILQMYLTVTSYGSNIVGIQSASKFYFGKDPKDLTLAEAAILASIIQKPSYLSPTQPFDGDTETSQKRVKDRQLYVLNQLRENKDIINTQILEKERENAKKANREFNVDEVELFTEEIIAAAENEDIKYRPPLATDIKAGHFVNFVLRELQTENYKNGEPFTEEELHTGGYRIYTTLDYELQLVAEEYANKAGNQYDYWNIHNAALMTLTPKNGEIITMAGSKGFFGENEGCNSDGINCWYNPEVNVLATLQSPGSTNKVVAYYLANELGIIYPGDVLPDIPISFSGYNPKNWDGSYRGIENTAREMLRQSRNLPALVMAEAIGINKYIETSREFGYSSYADESQFGHSLVLGGGTVYPYEHAAAFGVFANQGNYVRPESILKIEDSKGNIIYEARPEPKQVASPQGTFIVNQMLYNLEGISWDGRDIAAKTGTSEDNIDSLMVAWSPDFVTLGWVGNNNNDPADHLNGFASIVVKPWLVEYMKSIGNAPYFNSKTPFSRPGFVFRGGGKCNEKGECIGLSADWMIEGKSYSSKIKQKEVLVCSDQPNKLARDIDIALGLSEVKIIKEYKMPAPSWQNYLDSYSQRQGNINRIPTEDCDVDRSSIFPGPIIRYESISSPDSNTLSVKLKVFKNNDPIEKVYISLNGQVVKTVEKGFPQIDENINISELGLTSGEQYEVSVLAVDSEGDTDTFLDQITLGASVGPVGNAIGFGTLQFEYVPPTNLTYGISVGPGLVYTVSVKYNGESDISNVQLYQVNETTSETILLGDMDVAPDNSYFFSEWGKSISVSNASYSFYAIAVTKDGKIIQSPKSQFIEVSVQ